VEWRATNGRSAWCLLVLAAETPVAKGSPARLDNAWISSRACRGSPDLGRPVGPFWLGFSLRRMRPGGG